MSYLYEGKCTTQEGKVIYRRKIHPFTACDLKRIAIKVQLPVLEPQMVCYFEAAQDILLKLQGLPSQEIYEKASELRNLLSIRVSEPWAADEDFGEFGGGGSTRRWWENPLDPFFRFRKKD